jgi:SAM-dependent methyltransferase
MHTIDFKHFALQPGDLVLDLGCGEGRHCITAYMLADVTSVGVDLSPKDLRTARDRFAEFEEPDNQAKKLLISAADACHLPFANHSFDKVICSEVLEHIPDYKRVLAEIHRVLKPGGVFAVSVPRFGPEWICWQLSDAYHAMQGGHIRIFRAGELRKDIEAFGMVHFRRHWAHALHVPFWWLKCLFWRESEEDSHWIVRTYHKFLVWDLMKNPWITRNLEKILDPLLGKSVVMYFIKGLHSEAR